MKIALAQINPIIADLAGNVERCLEAITAAHAQGADLVVLPEMAVPGYPPRDILFDASFREAIFEATRDLATQTADGPPVLVGTVTRSEQRHPDHPGLYNAAVLLRGGDVQLVAAKQLLPAYDVFHEPRWFVPGGPTSPIVINGRRVGILVCEDLWDVGYPDHPAADLLAAGAELLIVIAASPYRRGVLAQRLEHARRPRCPLVYVNMVGGNDELIFDGRSFALDAAGEFLAQLPGFAEALQVVDVEETGRRTQDVGLKTQDAGHRTQGVDGPSVSCGLSLESGLPSVSGSLCPEAEVFHALALGVRDFTRKNSLQRVLLGLSGGIDSAVVAAIAAEALGPVNVTALALPGRYTDPRSTSSAEELARALGLGFAVVPIEPLHAAAEIALADLLDDGVTAENVQARLRALILMAWVNRHGGILLNCSNKTELALGYGTLYGDLAGTLCPIGDLTKPQVYALAEWIQTTRGAPIPEFILTRAPSAELKPEQVDPFDYPTISPQLERLIHENRSNAALRRSEHKRWHMGVILKVSAKAFGSGRLIPITRR